MTSNNFCQQNRPLIHVLHYYMYSRKTWCCRTCWKSEAMCSLWWHFQRCALWRTGVWRMQGWSLFPWILCAFEYTQWATKILKIFSEWLIISDHWVALLQSRDDFFLPVKLLCGIYLVLLHIVINLPKFSKS